MVPLNRRCPLVMMRLATGPQRLPGRCGASLSYIYRIPAFIEQGSDKFSLMRPLQHVNSFHSTSHVSGLDVIPALIGPDDKQKTLPRKARKQFGNLRQIYGDNYCEEDGALRAGSYAQLVF